MDDPPKKNEIKGETQNGFGKTTRANLRLTKIVKYVENSGKINAKIHPCIFMALKSDWGGNLKSIKPPSKQLKLNGEMSFSTPMPLKTVSAGDSSGDQRVNIRGGSTFYAHNLKRMVGPSL